MTFANAIKALEKHGHGPMHRDARGIFSRAVGNSIIEIVACSSGPDYPDGYDPDSSTIINVRAPHDHSDLQSDYHAGMFADSMRQALRWANA